MTRLNIFIALFLTCSGGASAQSAPPLRLEKTIPLPEVQGRIDHLSIDTKHQRLFVAALGNNTVEVIDLKAGKLAHSIPGLSEPQGVLYVPAVDRLFVANAKDGTVRVFDGTSFKLLKNVSYGDDADNLRFDSASGAVYVGYGGGALGALDKKGGKTGDIQLDAHPESFQLEKDGPRIFVNLPKSRKIAVVNRKTGAVTGTWNTGGPQQNYPMAFDEANHRLFVVCRSPARLVVLDTNSGKVIQSLPTSGDCDDVFYDQARTRLYAIGGEGAISVFQQENADHYTELATIKTVKGARTGFFSPELGRLYVAARKQGAQPAAIRVYEAQP